MKKKYNKSVWGWAIYDWANSAFATSVLAGFFPIFFREYWSHGANSNLTTAQLGFGNSLSGLIIALSAPILGAIADRSSARKKFLFTFAYIGILMTAALFIISKGNWMVAIFIYITGVIGWTGANIFYDSLLPAVADEDNIDQISCLGYSCGYLGGGLLFLINVLWVLFPEGFGFADKAMAVKFSFLSVAIWWGSFSIFTIIWVKERKNINVSSGLLTHTREGFSDLIRTLKEFRHLKTVFLFLLAYWFYIDGVDTFIRMAVDYGMSIGFSSTDLIAALLIVQFVAFPAALAYGKLGTAWGVKKAIFLGIFIYMGITIWGTLMTQKFEFYILAVSVGMVQGGVQALSRSYYARLIPKSKVAQYYGFYNMLGKFAVILGPALMGAVGLVARRILMPTNPTPEQIQQVGQLASRWSIGSILILFIIGGILFYFVDEEKGKLEAEYLENH